MRGMDVSYSTNATLNSVTASATSAVSDVGITVPGSHSSQKFSTAYVGALESVKHSMVFKLFGGTMPKPITVKHKPKCVTCGKQNKATAKFCTECGTALEIFA
jgi:rRNA maturation endonuclease Nob1